MRMHRVLGVVVLLCGLALSTPAHAACGDGVVDAEEHCDHGAANGADGCCAADCLLVDHDFDGLCDAFDGCDSFANETSTVKEPVLEIRGLATPPGDDRLRLSGRITLDATPAVDPATQGMQVAVFDSPADGFAEGTRVLLADLPPGARWVRRGERWTYRDPAGSAGGVTRVALKLRAPIVPTTRLVDAVFAVEARRGAYVVTPEMVTAEWDPDLGTFRGHALVVQVAFVEPSLPANPHCGRAYVTSVLPTRCTFSPRGTVTCEGWPTSGPCRLGDPGDLLVCDVLNAVRGQARRVRREGTYFTGDCEALPGVAASPGVACTTAGNRDAFQVSATHPGAPGQRCIWDSAAADPDGRLTCF